MATLASTSTLAQQCNIDSAHLKADYKITNTHKNEQSTQSLTLWRNNSQVAHQRGIEYQPSEVRGVQSWSAKNQLVDTHLIEKMTLVNTQGSGCDEVKNYTLTEGDNQFKLALFTKSNLVKSFSVTNKKSHTHTDLNLNDVSSNKAEITAQFAKWDRFQTTDYADIGDNENDPFLAKMINLGFIEHGATGFYNQQGKAIQGGHHH